MKLLKQEQKAQLLPLKERSKRQKKQISSQKKFQISPSEGVRNVTTPGKKGVRTIVETVTYTDSKETGRVSEGKSNEITTPAVDEVVEVG